MTIQNSLSQIWYTRCPVPTPVGLATQLGLLEATFADEGIALRSIIDDPDPRIRSSHFDHHLPFSFRHGGNVPPIRARSDGAGTRLVGITWTDEFQAILTLPDSGITTTADLAGRRFGVPHRPAGIVDFMAATALKGLESALSLAGVPEDQVQIVRIAQHQTVLEEHASTRLYGLRAHTVAEFGFHPDPKIRINSGSPRILTVDDRLAEERPDLVTRLLETLIRAGDWASAHPEETRRFVARETGSSEEAVLAANGPDLHHHLGIGLDPDLIDAIGHYKDFLFRRGFLTDDFDIRDWLDRRPFDAITDAGAARGRA